MLRNIQAGQLVGCIRPQADGVLDHYKYHGDDHRHIGRYRHHAQGLHPQQVESAAIEDTGLRGSAVGKYADQNAAQGSADAVDRCV